MLKTKTILVPLLLLFWGGWFLVASTSNLCDLLLASHILPQRWPFHSGNLYFIAKTISIYHFSPLIAKLMLSSVFVVELVSAVLFLLSLKQLLSANAKALIFINAAFTLSASLWLLFLISSELFVFYAFTSKHLLLLAVELISYSFIRSDLRSEGMTYDQAVTSADSLR